MGEALSAAGVSLPECALAMRIEYQMAALAQEWQAANAASGSTESIQLWAYRELLGAVSKPGETSADEVEARIRALGRYAKLPYAAVTATLERLLNQSSSVAPSATGGVSTVGGASGNTKAHGAPPAMIGGPQDPPPLRLAHRERARVRGLPRTSRLR